MSVAFEIEVTRSVAEARWRALGLSVPAAGLALAALQLASGPTLALDGPAELRVAAAIACAALAGGVAIATAFVLRRSALRAAASSPVLVVDEAGEPTLRGADGNTSRPMALRASCTLPGLTLLVLAPYPPHPQSAPRARPTTLLLGRDRVPDEAWRRLHVWLRWIDRGRHQRPSP